MFPLSQQTLKSAVQDMQSDLKRRDDNHTIQIKQNKNAISQSFPSKRALASIIRRPFTDEHKAKIRTTFDNKCQSRSEKATI